MKIFKRPSHPYRQMITGILLILFGIPIFFQGSAYSVPSDYDINAFDAIFIIPMLIKIFCYEILEGVSQFGVIWGLFSMIGGISCILPVVMSEPEPTDYFTAGDIPSESELRQMLESGEITTEEYHEIRQYASQRKK